MTTNAFTQQTLEMSTLRPPLPIESTPIQYESQIADKIRAGIELAQVAMRKVVSVGAAVGTAIAETGRVIGRLKVGLSYAVGAVAAGVAIYNTAKGIGDLNTYEALTTAASTALGLEDVPQTVMPEAVAGDKFAAGGIAAGIGLTSTLVGLALSAENSKDTIPPRPPILRPVRQPDPRFFPAVPKPVPDLTLDTHPGSASYAYVRPDRRLDWLDEVDTDPAPQYAMRTTAFGPLEVFSVHELAANSARTLHFQESKSA